jgi:hypothetical protein
MKFEGDRKEWRIGDEHTGSATVQQPQKVWPRWLLDRGCGDR